MAVRLSVKTRTGQHSRTLEERLRRLPRSPFRGLGRPDSMYPGYPSVTQAEGTFAMRKDRVAEAKVSGLSGRPKPG